MNFLSSRGVRAKTKVREWAQGDIDVNQEMEDPMTLDMERG